MTSESVALSEDAPPGDVVLVLGERGAPVSGRVVDDRGVPVAGARVEIGRGSHKESWTQTGRAGEFHFTGFEEESVWIQASHSVHKSVMVAVRPGEPVDLVLVRPCELHGIVRDAVSGEPITTFRVFVQRDRTPHAYGPGHAFCDVAVKFAILDLEPGRKFVAVYAPGYAMGQAEVEFASGDERAVEIELSRGMSISGRVAGEGGKPIEGAQVVVLREGEEPAAESKGSRPGGGFYTIGRDGRRVGFLFEQLRADVAQSGADGTFSAEGGSPGLVSVHVQHPDYVEAATEVFEVTAGVPVDIGLLRLRLGAGIEGAVFDARGRPYPAGAVELKRIDVETGSSRAGHRVVHLSPDGRFRTTGLLPGRYAVEYFGEPSTRVEIDLRDDKVEEIEIRLPERRR